MKRCYSAACVVAILLVPVILAGCNGGAPLLFGPIGAPRAVQQTQPIETAAVDGVRPDDTLYWQPAKLRISYGQRGYSSLHASGHFKLFELRNACGKRINARVLKNDVWAFTPQAPGPFTCKFIAKFWKRQGGKLVAALKIVVQH